jgi:sulfur carrier protein ThiS
MTEHAAHNEDVTLTYRRDTYTVRAGQTVRDAIAACGLDPATVLAVRNGELVPGDAILQPGDRVTLVATISGG